MQIEGGRVVDTCPRMREVFTQFDDSQRVLDYVLERANNAAASGITRTMLTSRAAGEIVFLFVPARAEAGKEVKKLPTRAA